MIWPTTSGLSECVSGLFISKRRIRSANDTDSPCSLYVRKSLCATTPITRRALFNTGKACSLWRRIRRQASASAVENSTVTVSRDMMAPQVMTPKRRSYAFISVARMMSSRSSRLISSTWP